MIIMSEERERRHTRVRDEVPIRWRVEASGDEGEGTVRDLSITGALLHTRIFSQARRNIVLRLEVLRSEDAGLLPSRARIVWRRPATLDSEIYSCGVEFIDPSADETARLQARVKSWQDRAGMATNANILENYCHRKDRLSSIYTA